MTVHKILFSFMITLSLVYQSSAINCYECTSAGINGTACLDPMSVDEESRSLIPVVTCEVGVQDNEHIQFFCRKTVQTIYLPKHGADVRIARACGWVRHEEPCYRTRTVDYMETSCQCFTDLCNSAESLSPTTVAALFVLFSACLYFYR